MVQVVTALLKIQITSPSWCGPVNLAPGCKPKGRQFDSQSRHMPGLRARSPVEVHEWRPHIDVSFSYFSLLSPLSKNK